MTQCENITCIKEYLIWSYLLRLFPLWLSPPRVMQRWQRQMRKSLDKKDFKKKAVEECQRTPPPAVEPKTNRAAPRAGTYLEKAMTTAPRLR